VVGPGDIIGDYVIEALIGEGANATVYRARHPDGRKFALKFLSRSDDDTRLRMEREARVLRELRHDNIVGLEETLTWRELPVLVMAFVDGPDLGQWLDTEGAPTLAEALALVSEICRGLAHAHRNGAIHRDLKPDNVLLAVTDGALTPRLADFGLAKVTGDGNPGALVTQRGSILGTGGYMSPEQMVDAASVDHRSDLYSLGCLFYRILCGRPPFDQGDFRSQFSAMSTAGFPPPEELAPGMPDELYALLRGLLEIDRDDRPQTAEEVLAALEAIPLTRADPTAPMAVESAGGLLLWGGRAFIALPVAAAAVAASVVLLSGG